jgi:hypothetical protein
VGAVGQQVKLHTAANHVQQQVTSQQWAGLSKDPTSKLAVLRTAFKSASFIHKTVLQEKKVMSISAT